MTGREFMAWVESHGCFRDENVENFSVNATGFSVVYRRKGTSYFFYFSGPFDDEKDLPYRLIKQGCDQLHIECPVV